MLKIRITNYSLTSPHALLFANSDKLISWMGSDDPSDDGFATSIPLKGSAYGQIYHVNSFVRKTRYWGHTFQDNTEYAVCGFGSGGYHDGTMYRMTTVFNPQTKTYTLVRYTCWAISSQFYEKVM